MKTLALLAALLLAACSQSNNPPASTETEWLGIWRGTFNVVYGPNRGVLGDAEMRIDHWPPNAAGVQAHATLTGIAQIDILHGFATEIGRLDLEGPAASVVMLAETNETAVVLISLASGEEIVADLQQMATWTQVPTGSPRR